MEETPGCRSAGAVKGRSWKLVELTTLSSRLQHLSSGYELAAWGPSMPVVPAACPSPGEHVPAEPPSAGTARAHLPALLLVTLLQRELCLCRLSHK